MALQFRSFTDYLKDTPRGTQRQAASSEFTREVPQFADIITVTAKSRRSVMPPGKVNAELDDGMNGNKYGAALVQLGN